MRRLDCQSSAVQRGARLVASLCWMGVLSGLASPAVVQAEVFAEALPSDSSPSTPSAAESAERPRRHGELEVPLHDPSRLVKSGDAYWCFATGTGISVWRSRDRVRWERQPRVFPEMPGWVREVVPTQRGHFWAPDVIEHRGRFLLYYSVSQFGRNTSAIALASIPTLDPATANPRWKDEGVIVRSRSDDDFNAIDPCVVRTDEGELWLAFGSFWSGIKLMQLDAETGRRSAASSSLYDLAWKESIEAPHLFAHDGHYYLFVNWGRCCRGVDSTYEIRVGRSEDIRGPYHDREGKPLLAGGGSLVIGSDGPFIGPGHASVLAVHGTFWLSCHFYDGTDGGRAKLAILPLRWDPEGWPVGGTEEPMEVP